jgi:hypothetical protein
MGKMPYFNMVPWGMSDTGILRGGYGQTEGNPNAKIVGRYVPNNNSIDRYAKEFAMLTLSQRV